MNQQNIAKLIRQAKYIQSTVKVSQLPEDVGVEFAFMGRSNAGKSSVINALTGIKIAKTSKTPGRTQCMNVFELNSDHRLVDFPGYGFAKISIEQTKKWRMMVRRYLQKRQCITAICIIMDIRHPNQKTDLEFMSECYELNLPIHILLNKADKLSKNQAQSALLKLKNSSSFQLLNQPSAQIFSARTKLGHQCFCEHLQLWADTK